MESQTLTIMFTDMQGFTGRTSRQSREATMNMIKRHKELLLPSITKHNGRLVKTIGDAFLMTFESPTNAVLAGIALQDILKNHNQQVDEDGQIKVRLAINTGEVTLDHGDVYGDAVNIASRIQGISEENEIYFTESTYLSMNKSEVPSVEIGFRHLKGIPRKVKIYKVLKERKARSHMPFQSSVLLPGPLASKSKRVAAFVIDFLILSFICGLLLGNQIVQVQRNMGNIHSEVGKLSNQLDSVLNADLDAIYSVREEKAVRRESVLKEEAADLEERKLKLEEFGYGIETRKNVLAAERIDLEKQLEGFSQTDEAIPTDQIDTLEAEFEKREILLKEDIAQLEKLTQEIANVEDWMKTREEKLIDDVKKLEEEIQMRRGKMDRWNSEYLLVFNFDLICFCTHNTSERSSYRRFLWNDSCEQG